MEPPPTSEPSAAVGVRPSTATVTPTAAPSPFDADRSTTPSPSSQGLRAIPEVAPWAVVLACCAFALGIFLRLWLVSNTGVNSDEAVVGLMAKQILHGHFTTFFWGQAYGGVEPYVVAVAFAAFGSHPWLVEVVPAVLAAGGCVLLWRLGGRVFSPTVGLVAASVAWIWPESNVRDSVQEYGFRGVVFVCGITALLCTVRIVAREDSRRTWAVLGGVAGLGWWASPEILYFLAPAALGVAWTLVRPRRPLRRVAVDGSVALACTALGALPWLYTNVTSHFPSLRIGTYYTGGTYGGRLDTFFAQALPIALGTRTVGSGAWLGGRLGPLLYGVVAGVLVVSSLVAFWRVPLARPLVAFLAIFPFLYATQPTGYWRDGRFVVYLAPVAAAVVLGAASTLVTGATSGARTRRGSVPHRIRRHRWVLAGLLATLAALAASASSVESLALTTSFGDRPFAVGDQGVESAPKAIVAALERHRITRVYAQYWVAYVVDLVSNGAITATPPDAVRSRALFSAVSHAPRAAWLFTGPTDGDRQQLLSSFADDASPYDLTPAEFVGTLSRAHLRSVTVEIGPMVAVVPSHQVTPRGLYLLETQGHL